MFFAARRGALCARATHINKSFVHPYPIAFPSEPPGEQRYLSVAPPHAAQKHMSDGDPAGQRRFGYSAASCASRGQKLRQRVDECARCGQHFRGWCRPKTTPQRTPSRTSHFKSCSLSPTIMMRADPRRFPCADPTSVSFGIDAPTGQQRVGKREH